MSATIRDSCCCGAEFSATGPDSWVGGYHRDWLARHSTCRDRLRRRVEEPFVAVEDHLREDAEPVAVCGRCRRKTWTKPETPTCQMRQPDGSVCGGAWTYPAT